MKFTIGLLIASAAACSSAYASQESAEAFVKSFCQKQSEMKEWQNSMASFQTTEENAALAANVTKMLNIALSPNVVASCKSVVSGSGTEATGSTASSATAAPITTTIVASSNETTAVATEATTTTVTAAPVTTAKTTTTWGGSAMMPSSTTTTVPAKEKTGSSSSSFLSKSSTTATLSPLNESVTTTSAAKKKSGAAGLVDQLKGGFCDIIPKICTQNTDGTPNTISPSVIALVNLGFNAANKSSTDIISKINSVAGIACGLAPQLVCK